ncbi:hypothetical protein Pmar_PMAR027635 [Perkinsus marinus ATCC 50983]|uniref:Uncharacterized protein n=1 Tax=Perkinsus marinus (strain ATCC 50983 / TXsc) TaxID=423536 RepID=C5KCA6_PERM5|nr:hypothetical protein Pmar_PMAR027635 [Perkinsus marinus ATCC 50983]EER17919.1 hypothetical protein Pmar_PMAR027635 [Perkinsus marinus ATCC 50983]|eukprot:XP_002786123.1 hypothetical protein Pmar_PMAR027635 [Perkinsus marinus ATCC 50983]
MARLLSIFATIAGVMSIQADPFADDLVANFTALLGNPDVHKFIDKALMDTPAPPNPNRSELGEVHVHGDLANGRRRYEYCSKCKGSYSKAIVEDFVEQISLICGRFEKHDSVSTDDFCARLRERRASLDEFLRGYIFVRSRALQLATSECIGADKCPTHDAYNAFLNPIVPGRLVDFIRFSYCPHRPFHTVSSCFERVSEILQDFAFRRVMDECDHGGNDDLEEFCSYVTTRSHFGRGLVFGFVGVYELATGYCVADHNQSQ